MSSVRDRIVRGGERLWQISDFRDLSLGAVAQALSRLKREGALERLSKGVYYKSKSTSFGKSRPSPTAIQQLAAKKPIFPSGTAAANILGFTTQTAKQHELSTVGFQLPRKLLGADAIVHTRRPPAWEQLSPAHGAMLDFLRRRGQSSELSPSETVQRTLKLLATDRCFERLVAVADSEPPRVRALLGALGESLGVPSKILKRLRDSLNPLSRFDFGVYALLPSAERWQSKGKPR